MKSLRIDITFALRHPAPNIGQAAALDIAVGGHARGP
jgi:hypothetical protein